VRWGLIYLLIKAGKSDKMGKRDYMKAIIQRVKKASVEIDSKSHAKIKHGLLVFLGVGKDDAKKDAEILAQKIAQLRIFADKDGKFNLSLLDTKGEMLIISQFTLCADTSKGRRPSFHNAAPPIMAEKLYDYFVSVIKGFGIKAQTGVFGANMEVALINDGPVTIVLDTNSLD